MTGASIPPERPKATVTVESNEIHVSVRAPLCPQEARDLIDALWGALAKAEGRQSMVSKAFREYESSSDHDRSERNTDH